MVLMINIISFIIAGGVLAISAFLLTKSLSKIASFLRLSEFVVAFILMAFSTSLPELFIGINSALDNNPALSLGNVIGSNIADLTLVLGVAVILAKGIKIKKKHIVQDTTWMFFIAILPMLLMVIGKQLSRLDGLFLIIVFVVYSFKLIKERRYFHTKVSNHIKKTSALAYTLLFVLSLVVLFFSANKVVELSNELAIDLLLPPILIGLFLIALATSLPELAFEITSVKTGHPEFALGDSFGSVVVNSTLVLGVTALISPITANFLFFLTSAMFMIIICLLVVTFVESDYEIDLKEGIALVSLYLFFVIVELTIQGYFKTIF